MGRVRTGQCRISDSDEGDVMSPLKRLGVLVVTCAIIGWVCGGMEDEAKSYIVGIVLGLGAWYILFGEIL